MPSSVIPRIMSDVKAPAPNVFDRNLVIRRRLRVQEDEHFLAARCAEDAAERLLDINRNFEHALIIGPQSFCDDLLAALPDGKLQAVTLAPQDLDEEVLPYAAQSFDVILCALRLHSVNDLPGALVQMRAALRPDGVLIAAMFGGQTLTELRSVLYEAEDLTYGGITPRIAPMADFQQLASLLQRTGFALPVVDTDRVTVRYSAPLRLLSDLKNMGESNALTARSRKPVSKRFLNKIAQVYAEHHAGPDGKVPATFEILWLTGWAPHESQQKPLKPGSAKMRLADALGATEVKVKRD